MDPLVFNHDVHGISVSLVLNHDVRGISVSYFSEPRPQLQGSLSLVSPLITSVFVLFCLLVYLDLATASRWVCG